MGAYLEGDVNHLDFSRYGRYSGVRPSHKVGGDIDTGGASEILISFDGLGKDPGRKLPWL